MTCFKKLSERECTHGRAATDRWIAPQTSQLPWLGHLLQTRRFSADNWRESTFLAWPIIGSWQLCQMAQCGRPKAEFGATHDGLQHGFATMRIAGANARCAQHGRGERISRWRQPRSLCLCSAFCRDRAPPEAPFAREPRTRPWRSLAAVGNRERTEPRAATSELSSNRQPSGE